MEIREAYLALDLPFGATATEIEQSFRDLVRVWHPDRFEHDASLQRKATERLSRINEAYSVLSQELQADDEQSSASAATAHREQCKYLGRDPRLASVGFFNLSKRAAVEVTEDGIVLAILGPNGPDEILAYPTTSLRVLWEPRGQWNAPSSADFFRRSAPSELPPYRVCFLAIDPEGILDKPISVYLEFLTEYQTQLFAKRARAILDLFPAPAKPPDPRSAKAQAQVEQLGNCLAYVAVAIAFCGMVAFLAWMMS